MRRTINGRIYDTNRATEIAHWFKEESDDYLYQTASGEFFLVQQTRFLDGKPLGPLDCVADIAPEVEEARWPCPSPCADPAMLKRMKLKTEIIPVSADDALRWCIRVVMPQTFVGRLLECVP